jgi:hypothetical protein
MRKFGVVALALACLLTNRLAFGQLDPDKRELIQFGFDRSLEGAAPLEGYGFYYLNEPNFFRTNITLRLAVAPVYLDSETGFVGLLGPHTDFGLGLAGGGFADNYYEYHDGSYQPGESFYGHSLEASASIYHLFNPGQKIPLYGIFRIKDHYSDYSRDQTASNFQLPQDHWTTDWRAGLRWGGREPLLHPDLAMELSAWYEGQYRNGSGLYGFNNDRELQEYSHLFWGRALLIYTFPNSRQSFDVSLTTGTSIQADRFSAYRVGGTLPLATEYPLVIPGYFDGELSARNFACFTAQYTLPLDPSKRWSLEPIGSIATMDYLPGLAQHGHFNSGVGIGLSYRAPSGAWRAVANYGYGFEAIRSDGRGADSISLFLEINLGARHPGAPSRLDHITSFFLNHF